MIYLKFETYLLQNGFCTSYIGQFPLTLPHFRNRAKTSSFVKNINLTIRTSGMLLSISVICVHNISNSDAQRSKTKSSIQMPLWSWSDLNLYNIKTPAKHTFDPQGYIKQGWISFLSQPLNSLHYLPLWQ